MIKQIEEKINEILEKKKTSILSFEEEQTLILYRELLSYLESKIKLGIADQILINNQETVVLYQEFLNQEIQKYAKELDELSQKTSIGRSKKKLAKFITNVKQKLEKRRQEKRMLADSKEFAKFVYRVEEDSTKGFFEKVMGILFSNDLLKKTSFQTESNAFFENGKLNIANVNLVLEVLKDKKVKNLKSLIEIEELKRANLFFKGNQYLSFPERLSKLKEIAKKASGLPNTLELDDLKQNFLLEFKEVHRLFNKYITLLSMPLKIEEAEIDRVKTKFRFSGFPSEIVQSCLENLESQLSLLMKNITVYQEHRILENQNIIEQNENTLPEEVKNANIFCLNRINYYCQLPFIAYDQGGPILGSFVSSKKIDENKEYSFPNERVEIIVKNLTLAKRIYDLVLMDSKELAKNLAVESDLSNYNKIGEDYLNQMISYENGYKR